MGMWHHLHGRGNRGYRRHESGFSDKRILGQHIEGVYLVLAYSCFWGRHLSGSAYSDQLFFCILGFLFSSSALL